MPTELLVLALGALLLLVHILLAAHFKTKQYGVEWNVGARDENVPALNDLAARLQRAQENFKETLPVAVIALLSVVITGKANDVTAIAAWTWLASRLIYLPLYWKGIPVVRTLVWGVSLVALLVILGVLMFG
ncbi:MAPEG family protein [Aurantiacibacter spongiae]|uniref:MAPEG family protein n=1 Tax=Aurantiacibacter spongiae TaxID=2488860 RepID=A0A3N5D915_9SPHN|nr:MAPEG family protein [Aurantiacibacter spongiae]RPF71078.1 hypothetical protein EG799_05210 [Aurantiacibacter spongiae]